MDNINIFREIDKRDLTKETFFDYLQKQFNDIRCNTYKLKDDKKCKALRKFFQNEKVAIMYGGEEFESQIADMVKDPEKPEASQVSEESLMDERVEEFKPVGKVVEEAKGSLPKEIKAYKEKLLFLIQDNIEKLSGFKNTNNGVCPDTTSTEITGDSDDLNKITKNFLDGIGALYFETSLNIEATEDGIKDFFDNKNTKTKEEIKKIGNEEIESLTESIDKAVNNICLALNILEKQNTYEGEKLTSFYDEDLDKVKFSAKIKTELQSIKTKEDKFIEINKILTAELKQNIKTNENLDTSIELLDNIYKSIYKEYQDFSKKYFDNASKIKPISLLKLKEFENPFGDNLEQFKTNINYISTWEPKGTFSSLLKEQEVYGSIEYIVKNLYKIINNKGANTNNFIKDIVLPHLEFLKKLKTLIGELKNDADKKLEINGFNIFGINISESLDDGELKKLLQDAEKNLEKDYDYLKDIQKDDINAPVVRYNKFSTLDSKTRGSNATADFIESYIEKLKSGDKLIPLIKKIKLELIGLAGCVIKFWDACKNDDNKCKEKGETFLSSTDKTVSVCVANELDGCIKGNQVKYGEFKQVFNAESSNQQVLDTLKEDFSLYDNLKSGQDFSFYAFGFSGSGKTYTLIQGGEKDPSVMRLILNELKTGDADGLTSDGENPLNVSWYYPYKHNNEGTTGLESYKGNINISNVYQETKNIENAMRKKLYVLPTSNNPNSSRAFTVFEIPTVFQGKKATLRFIDMPGNERTDVIKNDFIFKNKSFEEHKSLVETKIEEKKAIIDKGKEIGGEDNLKVIHFDGTNYVKKEPEQSKDGYHGFLPEYFLGYLRFFSDDWEGYQTFSEDFKEGADNIRTNPLKISTYRKTGYLGEKQDFFTDGLPENPLFVKVMRTPNDFPVGTKGETINHRFKAIKDITPHYNIINYKKLDDVNIETQIGQINKIDIEDIDNLYKLPDNASDTSFPELVKYKTIIKDIYRKQQKLKKLSKDSEQYEKYEQYIYDINEVFRGFKKDYYTYVSQKERGQLVEINYFVKKNITPPGNILTAYDEIPFVEGKIFVPIIDKPPKNDNFYTQQEKKETYQEDEEFYQEGRKKALSNLLLWKYGLVYKEQVVLTPTHDDLQTMKIDKFMGEVGFKKNSPFIFLDSFSLSNYNTDKYDESPLKSMLDDKSNILFDKGVMSSIDQTSEDIQKLVNGNDKIYLGLGKIRDNLPFKLEVKDKDIKDIKVGDCWKTFPTTPNLSEWVKDKFIDFILFYNSDKNMNIDCDEDTLSEGTKEKNISKLIYLPEEEKLEEFLLNFLDSYVELIQKSTADTDFKDEKCSDDEINNILNEVYDQNNEKYGLKFQNIFIEKNDYDNVKFKFQDMYDNLEGKGFDNINEDWKIPSPLLEVLFRILICLEDIKNGPNIIKDIKSRPVIVGSQTNNSNTLDKLRQKRENYLDTTEDHETEKAEFSFHILNKPKFYETNEKYKDKNKKKVQGEKKPYVKGINREAFGEKWDSKYATFKVSMTVLQLIFCYITLDYILEQGREINKCLENHRFVFLKKLYDNRDEGADKNFFNHTSKPEDIIQEENLSDEEIGKKIENGREQSSAIPYKVGEKAVTGFPGFKDEVFWINSSTGGEKVERTFLPNFIKNIYNINFNKSTLQCEDPISTPAGDAPRMITLAAIKRIVQWDGIQIPEAKLKQQLDRIKFAKETLEFADMISGNAIKTAASQGGFITSYNLKKLLKQNKTRGYSLSFKNRLKSKKKPTKSRSKKRKDKKKRTKVRKRIPRDQVL